MKYQHWISRPFSRILLIVFLVLSLLLVSCSDGKVPDPGPSEPTGPSEPDTPDQPTENLTELTLDSEFKVLRSDSSKEAVEACRYVIDAIKHVYGIDVTFDTDYLKRGASPDEGEKVILVGQTNRPASEELMKSLTVRDYAYAIPDNHTVVIAGHTAETTLAGAKKFCEDLFGYTGEGTGSEKALSVGAEYTYRYEYPAKVLTLFGHDVSEYTILYNSDKIADAAATYADSLYAYTGVAPRIVKGDQAEGYSISFRTSSTIGDLEYQVTVKDDNVVVEASEGNFTKALDLFQSLATESPIDENKTIAITYEEGEHRKCILRQSEYHDLRLVSRVDESVCPGVTYSRLSWKDREDKPVEGYLITVAPGAAKVEYGLPNAATEHTGVLATVGDQAVSATEAYGYDIVAAFNASLYDVNNHNIPYGLTYLHGERLSPSNGFMCFAVMKDGSFHAGEPSFKDKTQIWNCFGGHYTILEDGKMSDHRNVTDDFITIRHPRTAVGYDQEGTLMVLVVDGRQPEISNGASLYDMAMIFRSLGAYEAVNLDGGGSSIIYVQDPDGNLTYRNSPSDGHPRKVADSLLLVRNPDYQG